MNRYAIILEIYEQVLRISITHLFFIMSYILIMREDFAEYTKCTGCNASLLLCYCNCPKCGKREGCKCELNPINHDLGY